MEEMLKRPPEPKTELGRYRVLSSTAGIRVSPLQLGAMSIGDAWTGFMGSMNKEQSFELMDAYYEAGGNFIDTANNYQNEQSETWLGEWMKIRNNRDMLVIATKFSTGYKDYKLGRGKSVNYTGNHKRSLHMSVHDSLVKLQTDYIDILYVHWWDFTTSIEEVMNSLHLLVQQGKVLYLGVSDTPAYIVSAANTYAKAYGRTQFSIYQGRWNVMCRDMERDIVPMCRLFGMGIAPWDAIGKIFLGVMAWDDCRLLRPHTTLPTTLQDAEVAATQLNQLEIVLTVQEESFSMLMETFANLGYQFLGGGKFQSKKALEERKANNEALRNFFGTGQTENEVKMSEALEIVAAEHGIESVTAIALAYLTSKAPYVFPIIGGRKVEHLMDNIQALKIELTKKQIEHLESIVPFQPGFPWDFVGMVTNIIGVAPTKL